MKRNMMIGFISICVVLVIGFVSINLYSDGKLNNVENNVKEHNPEITRVESINSVGHWGEWFSEYSLVILIDDKKYRVWTNGDGEITDQISID